MSHTVGDITIFKIQFLWYATTGKLYREDIPGRRNCLVDNIVSGDVVVVKDEEQDVAEAEAWRFEAELIS